MERLPKKNLTAKIIALIMAVVLWVYVMNEQNPPVETSLEIPLEVRNLSSSVVAVDIPDTIRIKVRGPRTLIIGLNQADIKSYIDLKGLSDGNNTLKVTTSIPPSVELVEVNPDKINFRLDTIASRQVPIEARIGGTSPGNSIGKITYGSPNVTIKGPSELLDRVAKTLVDVDVAGKTGDVTVMAFPIPVDDKGKKIEGLTVHPGEMSVSLTLVPVVNKKVVDVKTNIVGTLAKGIVLQQITTKPEKVEISGDTKLIENTDFIYTEPIAITGIDKDLTLDVKLQIKEGITSNKDAVTVHISVAKQ